MSLTQQAEIECLRDNLHVVCASSEILIHEANRQRDAAQYMAANYRTNFRHLLWFCVIGWLSFALSVGVWVGQDIPALTAPLPPCAGK